jgi:8-oxo-dGTP pyrophosphatase MutT (NUDIX family)
MTLAERLRRALDESGRSESILLDSDDNVIPFAGDATLLPAAVLVPVTDRDDPGLLLTVRNAELRKHAGQVAFPGGRIDPSDHGPIAAALREAEEEIGLPASLVEVVGAVDRYRTFSGFDITPVIGVIPPDLMLVPHQHEVAAVFEVPLAHLLDSTNFAERTTDWQGRERRYFELMWEGHRIWGATAAMIVNIGRRIAGRL